MIGETPILTLEDAKAYFQGMGCFHFHMAREYPERYEEYRSLDVNSKIEGIWIAEEISVGLRKLCDPTTLPGDLWWLHSRVSELILRKGFEHYLEPLFEATERIEPRLEAKDRLLVAETIVGPQDAEYRPGLIFGSRQASKEEAARGFARLAWKLSQMPSPFLADEKRHSRLMKVLTRAANCCGIDLAEPGSP